MSSRPVPYRFLFRVLLVLLVSGGVYVLLAPLLSWKLSVTLSIRSLTPSHFTLSYSGINPSDTNEVQIRPLQASQFFSEHHFQFDGLSSGKALKLFLDEKTDYYFLRKISVGVSCGFLNKNLLDITGQEIPGYLLDQSSVSAKNEHLVVLDNRMHGRQIFFTENMQQIISGANVYEAKIRSWRLFAALVLGFTLVFLLPWGHFGNSSPLRGPEWKKVSLASYVFFAILLLMLVNGMARWIPDRRNTENRNLTALEPLHAGNFFTYPELLTDYTNDHFSFRNALFFAHSLLKAKVLQTASLPNRIILGKQGWFFEVDDFAMNDYRRLNRFEEKDLEHMARIMQERVSWLQERGIRYYVMVPPNRNRIYSELFPERYTVMPHHGHNRLDFFTKYLQESIGFRLIDPSDSLQYYKQFHDVYYSTDSHWNQFGAWVGYSSLIHRIQQDYPCLNPITYSELTLTDSFSNRGDLAAMLGLEDIYRRKEFAVSMKDTSQPLVVPAESGILFRMQNTQLRDSCGLKLMLFRDSYSNYLLPYLNRHFREVVCVWSYDFLHELIEQEKPDIVVLEVQQRAMIYGLQNPNLFKR